MNTWRLQRLNRSLAILLVVAVLQLMVLPGYDEVANASGTSTFTFTAAEKQGAEGDEIQIKLVRNGSTTVQQTVYYTTSNGTALSGQDYDARSGTLTFAPGRKEIPITVHTKSDLDLEGNEDFYLTISNPTNGAVLGAITGVKATIVDEQKASTGSFQFENANYTVDEDAHDAEFKITRTGATSGTAIVRINSINGTASNGQDYNLPFSNTVTFDNGETEKFFKVRINDDLLDEADESFQLRLYDVSNGGAAGLNRLVTVTIEDNDLPASPGEFYFDSNTIEVYENAGSVTLQISREDVTRIIEGAATVDYSLIGGTANAPGDYTPVSGTLNFESWRKDRYITVPIIDDLDDEGDEQFTIQLGNPTGGAGLGSPDTINVIIMDNDDTPQAGTIQFADAGYSVKEGYNSVEVIVKRTGGSDGEVKVDLDTFDDTARSSHEYEGVHTTVTFPAGSVTQKVHIPVYYTDGDKQFTVQLSNSTGGASVGTIASTNVTVEDDGLVRGTVGFDYAEVSVNERDPYSMESAPYYDVSLRLNLGPDGLSDTRHPTVDYTVTNGTAIEGVDFEFDSYQLEFDVLGRAQLDFKVLDNNNFEDNKTFTVTLANPTKGFRLGDITTLEVTIVEDDPAPSPGTFSFNRNAIYEVSESDSVVTVAVYRAGNPNWEHEVTVDYYTAPTGAAGDATAGVDYTAVSGTLTFGTGEAVKTISIPIVDDSAAEGIERFDVKLTNATGGATIDGTASSKRIAILDNDSESAKAKLSFSHEEAHVEENYESIEAEPVYITINRTGSLSGQVTVDYATVDGTALAGQDYEAKNGTITFQPGETSKQVGIQLIDDSLLEAEEDFSVQLSNPSSGAELGAISSFKIKVQDNEDARFGVFQFDQSSYTVDETSGEASFKIIRTGGSSGEVMVGIHDIPGTALEFDDYFFGYMPGYILFEDGQTEAKISVEIYEDALVEGDETFQLKLQVGGGAIEHANSTVPVTITDAPVGPTPGKFRFKGAYTEVSEGAGQVYVTVSRSGAYGNVSGVASVVYSVYDGTAVGGSDFVGATGTLTFAENELEHTIAIPIINDNTVEGKERFTVRLSNPTGGTAIVYPDTIEVTIKDNDVVQGSGGKLSFETAKFYTIEEAGPVSVKVLRSEGTAGVVTVQYNLVAKTAQAGLDYVAASGTLTFNPGETVKSFTVTFLDDAISDNLESFVIKLSNPTGGAILGPIPNGEVFIYDMDHLN